MTFPTPSGPIVSTFGAVKVHTVDVDEDLAAGDLLLINFCLNGGMNDPLAKAEVSDGLDYLVRAGNWIFYGGILYKVATGDEGGSITITTDTAARGVAHAYRIPAGQWYGSTSGVEIRSITGNASSINPPSILTSWGIDDNLYFMFLQTADDGAGVIGWPTGYHTNGTWSRSGTADNQNTMIASSWRQLATPGENPSFIHIDTVELYMVSTVAIRPLVLGTATVEVPRGELTLAGAAPAVAGGASVAVPPGEILLVGNAPTLAGVTILVPAVALFALTGNAPTVSLGARAVAPLGEVALAGNAPFIDTTLIWPASEELRRDAWAPASNLPLVLLRIDHDDLAAPILVVNNKENVTSNGDEYTAFPFEILLPDNQEGSPPQARLRISNVSREIGQAARSISTPATVDIYVVRQETPDTVEVRFEGMKLTNVKYDALVVEGTLEFENLSREAYPAYSFNPADFPGLIP